MVVSLALARRAVWRVVAVVMGFGVDGGVVRVCRDIDQSTAPRSDALERPAGPGAEPFDFIYDESGASVSLSCCVAGFASEALTLAFRAPRTCRFARDAVQAVLPWF